MSGQLKSSWELKAELKELVVSSELRIEVDNFIRICDSKSTGERQSISNLVYRGNMHYIIDNIKKAGMLTELKNFNLKYGV